MTGYEATEAIRRMERGTSRHIPIVAMTAHAMKGDRERCLASGMDHYVAKPIRTAELLEIWDASLPPHRPARSRPSVRVRLDPQMHRWILGFAVIARLRHNLLPNRPRISQRAGRSSSRSARFVMGKPEPEAAVPRLNRPRSRKLPMTMPCAK